jgi:predicted nucleotidyltransferase
MSSSADAATSDLPAAATRVLNDFVAKAREGLGDDLRSVVLYGSAAEGRLRPTSDLNVIVVLDRFEAARMDRLRETLRVGRAAARLAVMFLLASEVPAAVQAFAAKFADVRRRRRVLLGEDPFAGLTIPRAAEIARLRQVLLNLALRLRAAYVAEGDREERLAVSVADAAGPLRSCAATLLELQGRPAGSGKEALARLTAETAGDRLDETLRRLSEARETRMLPPGTAAPALLDLVDLAQRLRALVEAMPREAT